MSILFTESRAARPGEPEPTASGIKDILEARDDLETGWVSELDLDKP